MKGHYYKITACLTNLKLIHPEITMGKHLSTVLDEHDIWGMSDKDLADLFLEYARSLSLDKIHPDKEIDKIIDEGLHLDRYKLYEDADPPLLDD